MLNPNGRQPSNPFQFSNEVIDTNHGYDNRESINSGLWPPKPAQNYRSRNDMELQFGTERKEVEDSGICSPPLWRTSPPRNPQNRKNHYRSLSPASKTEAIARGQMELMEMVRNMPESTYELTLKDLVEQPRIEAQEEIMITEKNLKNKNVRREGSNRTMGKRNGNINSGGFYLKMVFPTSLGSKNKKKKNECLANNSSRVSPRPSVSDGSVKGGVDNKEWWKKDASVCVESDSGASSINSGSMKSSGSSSSSTSSRSNSRREKSRGGCLPFFRKPKSLTYK